MTGVVSANAHDAIAKGYLKKTTRVIMNPDAMIDEGKKMVLQIFANGYQRLMPPIIPLLGDYGRTAILFYELQAMLDGGFISEYDAYIGKKLAYVLSGGNAVAGTQVSEQYILDLEREAFPEPLRRGENTRTDGAYAANRQTSAKLKEHETYEHK